MMLKDDVLKLICCPDDDSEVVLRDGFIECLKCKRKHAILADNFIEILPLEFPKWDFKDGEPQKAEEMYLQEFCRRFSWGRNTGGWGDLADARPGTRAFYENHRNKIVELLNLSKNAVAIDVSGAVGNYSIFLADKVKLMVNCDLHTPSIITAYTRRKNNMCCIRAPYLRLPFSPNIFDYAICTDTLIRGWNHEIKLLKEIVRILKPGGTAVVDFHNRKWFSKNKNICEYNETLIKQLLAQTGIKEHSISKFGYVPCKFVLSEDIYPALNNIFRLFFPCQRYIVTFVKRQDSCV
jgi:ubiquinone/menaquinone biosynthesis C-methylase UbiE